MARLTIVHGASKWRCHVLYLSYHNIGYVAKGRKCPGDFHDVCGYLLECGNHASLPYSGQTLENTSFLNFRFNIQ